MVSGLAKALILILLAAQLTAQTCAPNNGVKCTSSLRLWLLPSNYASIGARYGFSSASEIYNLNFMAIDKALQGVVTPNFNTLAGGTNPNALGISGSLAPAGGTVTANVIASGIDASLHNLNLSGTCTGCPGAGSLPMAPALQQQVLQTDASGVAHAVIESNTFIDPVNRHALDNTGATPVGASLTSFATALPSTNPAPIILAPGFYNVSDGLDIPCSTTVCSGLVIQGSGRWATTIQSNCSGSAKDVLRLAKSTSGNIFTGFRIAHLTIKDTSGTGACRSLLDIVNQAGFTVDDVAVTGAKGKIYSTGTASVSNGSTAVTGTGTTWTADMCPGLFQQNGIVQECATVNSTTSITLRSNWQSTTTSGAAYAIDYYGNGLMLEPGSSGNFTQYATIRDLYSTGNRVCIYAAGTSSGGVSGITINGQNSQCEVRGSRTTDSVGHFWGKHTDTVRDETDINNVAFGVVLESAHANWISPRIENDSNVSPVTTCNGGVALQDCTIGIQLAADAGSTGYGNFITGAYVYLFGDAIKTVGTNADSALQIIGLRGPASFSANIHNYNFNGVTSWGGLPCPATGSGVHAVVLTFDCNHVTVAQTVN
jgi:hypothetical protein